MTEVEKVEQFIRELRSRHVVCLYPIIWNDFFLHFKRRLRNTLELPNPLVLGGWSASNDYDKRERFEEHIRLISSKLGLRAVTRYLDRIVKDEDYLTAPYVDPSEKSDMQIETEKYSKMDSIIKESSDALKRLIEIKPELIDSDLLVRFFHEYEEDTGIRSYQDKKLRLVHDVSEIRILSTEIYETYLKQKDIFFMSDLHDFCSHAIHIIEDTEAIVSR